MIVEFIGSTGAGKSTLIREVEQQLRAKAEVSTIYEQVAAPLGLNRISNPSVQNLIHELIGLPAFLLSLPNHWRLVYNSLNLMVRQPASLLSTINNLRSLIRKISGFEIARRNKSTIIIADEGVLLLPHNLFVFGRRALSREEIVAFGRLLPVPDRVIFVRAPIATLVSRAFTRNDLRRELKGKDAVTVEQIVGRATFIFDELAALPHLWERTLVIENPDATSAERAAIIQQITQFILA